MFEISIDDFLKKFQELKKNNEQKRPYSINIIDELHANENAHSRILMRFLSFSSFGRKPIFENFVSLLNEKLNDSVKIKDFSDPKFEGQFNYIDIYVYERDRQSVIIENKIDWAIDQDKQIERYVKASKNAGIPNNKIYLVYLTDDGRKKAADYSLTKTAKELLGMNNNVGENGSDGRYIELNYRYDILPFLKEMLAYLDFSKEVYLKAALVQYIDYLEGRYGIRTREKDYFDSIINELKEILKIKDSDIEKTSQKENVYNNINNFKTTLIDTMRKKRIDDKDSCFLEELESYLNALGNAIYPEEMRPRIIAKDVLFSFANKNKEVTRKDMPFKSACIIWSNPNMHNKIIFGTDTESVLDIVFTTETIIFQIRSTDFSNALWDFFTSYKKLPFAENGENEFRISFDEHYKNIKKELEELFKEMNNKKITG